jgi:hypothetical protein
MYYLYVLQVPRLKTTHQTMAMKRSEGDTVYSNISIDQIIKQMSSFLTCAREVKYTFLVREGYYRLAHHAQEAILREPVHIFFPPFNSINNCMRGKESMYA